MRVASVNLPRRLQFAAVVGAALLGLVSAATAQDFSTSYYPRPVYYDQDYFAGMPQYPAAGYGGGLYRRNAYSAGDVYVVEAVEPDVIYAPVMRREIIPVTTYAEVDTVVGYVPVMRDRHVHHRHAQSRRRCNCNGY
jgi:hypothetical protein